MVPGDLFQGFPGPNPLEILTKKVLGFLGVGGRGDPLWSLPSSLRGILTYLSEDPSLTKCFFPGRDGVGGWG